MPLLKPVSMQLPVLALVLTVLRLSLGKITITTPDGDLQGLIKHVTGRQFVSIFYGIPYAKPPVAQLRFRKPQPPTPWEGIKDATKLSNTCPQRLIIEQWYRKYEATTNSSEDCLYLNVWTPANQAINKTLIGKRDVIFWIHGGGFNAGSSGAKEFDGSHLAVIENVVFVSINYRLGPLGFLYLGNEGVPGNMGLYDMDMALNWVRRNIEAFGGNPASVTIVGNSAGAASVSALILSPVSRDKFQNAVIMSGSITAYWGYKNKEQALELAREFVVNTGCKKDSNNWKSQMDIPKEIVDCLQNLELPALDEAMNRKQNGTMNFAPTIDGHFLPEAPSHMISHGNYNQNISIMMGHTSQEGSMFAIRKFSNIFKMDNEVNISKLLANHLIAQTLPMLTDLGVDLVQHQYTKWTTIGPSSNYRDSIIELLGDTVIVCPNLKLAADASAFTKVYYYEFQHVANINSHLPLWIGAMHGDDIPFLFGSVFNMDFDFNDDDISVSRTMMKHLASFAHTGNPTPSQPAATLWSPFTIDEPNYFIYGIPSKTSVGPHTQQCTFLNKLLPKLLQNPGFSKTAAIQDARKQSSSTTNSVKTILNQSLWYLVILILLLFKM